MQGTQARPGNQGQSERFPKGSSPTRRIDAAPRWPTRLGDPFHALVKRRRPSTRSENNRPDLNPEIRRPTALQQFFRSFSLERSFTLLGFMVAVIVMSLFGLDLACGWPFWRASILFDVTSTICGAVLLLLSWDVCWEQVKGLTR
jgi:hypothetical protein